MIGLRVAALIALFVFAVGLFVFRYEPLPVQVPGGIVVWDRLGHRPCVALNGAYNDNTGPFCSREAFSNGLKPSAALDEPQAGSPSVDALAKMTGAQQRQLLLDKGVPADEVSQWEQQSREAQVKAGMKPEDINKDWGTTPPDKGK